MAEAVVTVAYEILTCSRAECGITYGITKAFERFRRADHKSFYCPNGHSQYFPGESDAERLRRVLNEKELELTRVSNELQTQNTKRRSAEVKLAKANRSLTRVKHGVCPCCTRTFAQLAAHMKRKHPDYKPTTP